jgi:hypothetical protein
VTSSVPSLESHRTYCSDASGREKVRSMIPDEANLRAQGVAGARATRQIRLCGFMRND